MRGHSIALVALLAGSCWAQEYSLLKSGTSENLRGLSAVSASVVWASGTHGTFLRTTDGGVSWSVAQVPGAEGLDFRDVEAFSADEAYLLGAGPGEQSRIYKTADGGKRWTLQFTNHDPKGFFDCMAFSDREHGIAVGDPVNGKFELIETSDGKTWAALTPATIPPAIEGEGAFAASGTCIAVQDEKNVWFVTGGKVARVFRSQDRGKNWTAVETPIIHGNESSGVFAVAFRDGKHGVISGGDYKRPEDGGSSLAVTEDGGQSWELLKISPQAYFSAVSFAQENIFALGSAHAGFGDVHHGWKKYWDLKLNALSVKNTADAFAVGPDGLIVRFTGLRSLPALPPQQGGRRPYFPIGGGSGSAEPSVRGSEAP